MGLVYLAMLTLSSGEGLVKSLTSLVYMSLTGKGSQVVNFWGRVEEGTSSMGLF